MQGHLQEVQWCCMGTKAKHDSESKAMSTNQNLVKEEKTDITVERRGLGNHKIGNIQLLKCKKKQSQLSASFFKETFKEIDRINHTEKH